MAGSNAAHAFLTAFLSRTQHNFRRLAPDTKSTAQTEVCATEPVPQDRCFYGSTRVLSSGYFDTTNLYKDSRRGNLAMARERRPEIFCIASGYEMASETITQTNAAAPGGAKPQPVAMEIPVTVNGASTVAGSDKRQPFSEATQTVLVFGSGAVVRLAAAVGPGQLLFVTNEKSKQEVVCQVVKTKQNGNGAGYVELKFTEVTTDFWGIRAPANGGAATPSAAPAIEVNGALTKSREQQLADAKSAMPAAAKPDSPPVAPAIPVVAPDVVAPAPANEIQTAPVVPAQPPATPKVPTLSEFLTHGSNGLELKARDTQQSQRSENREGPASVLIEEKSAGGQAKPPQASNQHDNKPSLSVALGVSSSPAPGSASFDLSADLPAEEVKIPSWLEPLARNAATAEAKLSEPAATEASNVELHADEKSPVSASVDAAEEYEVAPLVLGEGRAPNFGTSLPLGSETGRSGKGLKIALVAVVLALAAVAAWYWFVNQAPKVSAGGFGTVTDNNPASIPAPAANNYPSETTSAGATTNTISSKTNFAAAPPQPAAAITAPSRSSGSGASANTASAINAKSVVPSSTLTNSPEEEVAEPVKKATLGQVRLAAPKVTRNEGAAETGAADPGLALNGVAPTDTSSLSLLTNKSKGPAAPLPVGGDVKVATLISSVPPVYPQMARTQRVSGAVTIDALIDVNGRVSATRVISGPALLHDAAMSAVKQWKYQPATLNGVPTATHLTVTVQFKLQ